MTYHPDLFSDRGHPNGWTLEIEHVPLAELTAYVLAREEAAERRTHQTDPECLRAPLRTESFSFDLDLPDADTEPPSATNTTMRIGPLEPSDLDELEEAG